MSHKGSLSDLYTAAFVLANFASRELRAFC
jgi:hypothetical protein